MTTFPNTPYSAYDLLYFQLENILLHLQRKQQQYGINWISYYLHNDPTPDFLHRLSPILHDPHYTTPGNIITSLFPVPPDPSYIEAILLLHADFLLAPRLLF
jgi:hypothetical protein